MYSWQMIKGNENEIEKNVSKFCILQFKNAHLNRNRFYYFIDIFIICMYIWSYKIDWKLDNNCKLKKLSADYLLQIIFVFLIILKLTLPKP